MKTIEQVREEYTECPKGHGKENFVFNAENIYCEKCNSHYDLGMKKFE